MGASPIFIFREEDLLDRPKPPMLVDGLLVTGSLNTLVSRPGLGKSFLAVDLSLSIAAGRDEFIGLPLRACGPVVYVLGEGAGRFGLRLKAWKQHHGLSNCSMAFLWTNGPINLLDADEVAGFIEAIRPYSPSLVVFDTLSRCLVGADENAQTAMSKAVEHLDEIRHSVEGMTVLVLHHLNAKGSRERGSTVLNGAIDTQLRLKPKTRPSGKDGNSKDKEVVVRGQLTLTTDKQKDLELLTRSLTLVQHEVEIKGEFEEGGFPSRSLVLVGSESNEATGVESILKFVRTHAGCSKNDVAKAVGGRKTDVLKHLEQLIQDGVISATPNGQSHLLTVVDTTGSRRHPTGVSAGEPLVGTSLGTSKGTSKSSGKSHLFAVNGGKV